LAAPNRVNVVSDILSQAEIEALLSSLSGDGAPEGGAEAAPGDPAAAPAIRSGGAAGPIAPAARATNRSNVPYEVYDFRRPDKFSKDQLRTLQMLHETFARLSGSALSAYLRTQVQIDLISLEQVPYEEYLRSINQSVFTIMSLPPLSGQAALEMEFGLVFAMVDRLLGGPGRSFERTTLTDIEKPLIRQMIEQMFVALKSAWEGVVVINPTIEGMETAAQFVQIAPPNDIVVTILFEVRVGEQRTAMSLCIPYVVLKPITSKLSAQKWFAGSGRRYSPVSRRMLSYQVNQTHVECTVKLGSATITVEEFLKMDAGDVVRLDQRTSDNMIFLVGEVEKFAGKPALEGKKLVFAVNEKIEEE
jgi:flagellar motor switch protein FliM